METWGGGSEFEYHGSVVAGTTINYGNGNQTHIPATAYQQLLAHFAGRTVPCGTSRTNPPANSLGQWLQRHVSRTAFASYVGAILVREGYAQKLGSKIAFK